MIIYKISDAITYKIGPLTIKVMPLSFNQKSVIQAELMKANQNKDSVLLYKVSMMALRMSLKSIDGLTYPDGSKWEIKFEDGLLSEESLDELLNLPDSPKLVQLCGSFIASIPGPIEGVELVQEKKEQKNKKKA